MLVNKRDNKRDHNKMEITARNFKIEYVSLNLFDVVESSELNESSESKHTLSSFGARLKITTFDV